MEANSLASFFVFGPIFSNLFPMSENTPNNQSPENQAANPSSFLDSLMSAPQKPEMPAENITPANPTPNTPATPPKKPMNPKISCVLSERSWVSDWLFFGSFLAYIVFNPYLKRNSLSHSESIRQDYPKLPQAARLLSSDRLQQSFPLSGLSFFFGLFWQKKRLKNKRPSFSFFRFLSEFSSFRLSLCGRTSFRSSKPRIMQIRMEESSCMTMRSIIQKNSRISQRRNRFE